MCYSQLVSESPRELEQLQRADHKKTALIYLFILHICVCGAYLCACVYVGYYVVRMCTPRHLHMQVTG